MQNNVFETRFDISIIASAFENSIFSVLNDTDNEGTEKCKHENTRKDDQGMQVCMDCGNEVEILDHSQEWRYFGSNDNRSNKDPSRCHAQRKKSKKGIKSIFDSASIEIHPALVEVIQEKYDKVLEITDKKVLRGDGRTAIILACTLYVYWSIGESRTACYFWTAFHIKQKEMSNGIRAYLEAFPEDRTINIKTEHLIPWFMKLTGVDKEHYSRIMIITGYLSKASIILHRSNPQSVAASIIYFYLCIYPNYMEELGITKAGFVEDSGLSDITINKIVNDIFEVADLAAKDFFGSGIKPKKIPPKIKKSRK
jgi:transcription initiation factor TFIIIB Brf1 subunit/transcription initiation factor TFIIB